MHSKILKLQNLEKNIQSILTDFFTAAFTTICVKKGLAPNTREMFEHVSKFGMSVPMFKNSQAKEYVEGVAKKATYLIRHNALLECVFHVKEAGLYFRQKFVFKIEGNWNIIAIKIDSKQLLSDLKMNFRKVLHDIIRVQENLQPLRFPILSHWSISVGLRDGCANFLQQNGISNLVDSDDEDDRFPWKPTVRPTKAKSAVNNTSTVTLKDAWLKVQSEDGNYKSKLIPVSCFKLFEGLALNVFVLDYSEIIDKVILDVGEDEFLASTKRK